MRFDPLVTLLPLWKEQCCKSFSPCISSSLLGIMIWLSPPFQLLPPSSSHSHGFQLDVSVAMQGIFCLEDVVCCCKWSSPSPACTIVCSTNKKECGLLHRARNNGSQNMNPRSASSPSQNWNDHSSYFRRSSEVSIYK